MDMNGESKILIPKYVADAIKEYVLTINNLHKMHGSTAVHGGIGGSAITAHCSWLCGHPNHQPELDRVYAATKRLAELGLI